MQCCNSEGDSGVDIFFMTCSIVSKIKMKVLPVDIYIPDYPLSFDWTTESNVTYAMCHVIIARASPKKSCNCWHPQT